MIRSKRIGWIADLVIGVPQRVFGSSKLYPVLVILWVPLNQSLIESDGLAERFDGAVKRSNSISIEATFRWASANSASNDRSPSLWRENSS